MNEHLRVYRRPTEDSAPGSAQLAPYRGTDRRALASRSDLAALSEPTPQRVRDLVGAIHAVCSDLRLPAMIPRIAEAAGGLVDAQYVGLGINGPDGHLARFVHVTVNGSVAGQRDELPEGFCQSGKQAASGFADAIMSGGLAASDRRPPRTFLQSPIRVHEVDWGNLYLSGPCGRASFSEADVVLVDNFATSIGNMVEHASKLAESEAQRRWLSAVLEVSVAVSNADGEEAVGPIAACAVRAAEADFGVVIGGGPVGTAPAITAIAEAVPGAERSLLAMSPVIARALQTGEAVLDGSNEETGFIAVELAAAQRRLGVLCLGRSSRNPFTTVDSESLATFASQVCHVVELAQIRRQHEDDVRLAERERIAHALHADAIIDLFAVGIGLQAMSGALGGTVHESALLRYADQLDAVTHKVRQTVFPQPPTTMPVDSPRSAPESPCHL